MSVAFSMRETGSSEDDLQAVESMGRAARAAADVLATATTDTKNRALAAMAGALRDGRDRILEVNAEDLHRAATARRPAAFLDRLKLTAGRIEAVAQGLEAIAELPDPVGAVIADWKRPNGLRIARVRVPLGVIGIIYESRPNVTADAGALCLKAGNAAILRCGSDSLETSLEIVTCLHAGLAAAGLPEAAIQLVPTADRAAVGMMLKGLGGTIDVIVPRGGRSLVERVQNEARVPVFGHLEGICHVYVHEAADPEMARAVTVNAKMRRTGICGAAETLLIDRSILDSHGAAIIDALIAEGCEVRGDDAVRGVDRRVLPASDTDWGTEFLDAVIAVRAVGGVEEAMEHIARYGSQHTEAIITDDEAVAARFLREVDSAIVLHNASTQFADGGEFGMGAEIGIATGRLHARGPVGLEQLTTFKYVVRGSGQTRP